MTPKVGVILDTRRPARAVGTIIEWLGSAAPSTRRELARGGSVVRILASLDSFVTFATYLYAAPRDVYSGCVLAAPS
jgi:hypothetical protein